MTKLEIFDHAFAMARAAIEQETGRHMRMVERVYALEAAVRVTFDMMDKFPAGMWETAAGAAASTPLDAPAVTEQTEG